MIAVEVIIPALSTISITLGLAWIFYPAWLAAVADRLEWEETQISQGATPEKSILLSLVIPAYNEQARITAMLQAAHGYLATKPGNALMQKLESSCESLTGLSASANSIEWIVVDDGSKDNTGDVVRSTFKSLKSHHSWKLVSLRANSGKGAAVKTGMLLAKGHFRLMIDADGATDFGPALGLLVEQLLLICEKLSERPQNNKVAIFGSRAHLQEGSKTKRSFTRTILMHAFHIFVGVLVSSRVQDTQCGFKLFTKEAAVMIFESLHLQKWAFDTEVVLLCSHQRINIVEVGVPWREVDGSKLNTSKWALAVVSINMLRDMICVRACYALHIWNVAKNY